jgi:hypothetical protein
MFLHEPYRRPYRAAFFVLLLVPVLVAGIASNKEKYVAFTPAPL